MHFLLFTFACIRLVFAFPVLDQIYNILAFTTDVVEYFLEIGC